MREQSEEINALPTLRRNIRVRWFQSLASFARRFPYIPLKAAMWWEPIKRPATLRGDNLDGVSLVSRQFGNEQPHCHPRHRLGPAGQIREDSPSRAFDLGPNPYLHLVFSQATCTHPSLNNACIIVTFLPDCRSSFEMLPRQKVYQLQPLRTKQRRHYFTTMVAGILARRLHSTILTYLPFNLRRYSVSLVQVHSSTPGAQLHLGNPSP